ncbi:MAG: hypothetical protein CR988_06035 [Treponema sp.]|nr:MAG: hypothetical protein CR988_06035 [Treponema sp.]
MKRILSTALFLFVAVAGFAVDGGGIITSNTGFLLPLPSDKEKPVTNLSNYEKVSLWLTNNMNKKGNSFFDMQISYLFTANSKVFTDSSKQKDPVINHIVDLDYFNFVFFIPLDKGKAKLNFGRYGVMDQSGIVLNQKIDGVSVDVVTSGINFGFDFGFTGLLNRHTTPVYPKLKYDPSIIYSLSPAYLALSVDAVFPIGKYDHTLGVQILGFIQPKFKKPDYHTFFEISLKGSIIPGLMFDFTGVANIRNSFGYKQNACMGSLKLEYYFNKYNSLFGFKSLYAGGGDHTFVGFSKIPLTKVKPMFPMNTWLMGLYASIEPVDSLIIKMSTDMLFYGKKPKSSKSPFNGFEWNVGLNYTLLQDVYAGFDVGHFISASGSSDLLMNLKFMLSF